jgi:hypothetical protein
MKKPKLNDVWILTEDEKASYIGDEFRFSLDDFVGEPPSLDHPRVAARIAQLRESIPGLLKQNRMRQDVSAVVEVSAMQSAHLRQPEYRVRWRLAVVPARAPLREDVETTQWRVRVSREGSDEIVDCVIPDTDKSDDWTSTLVAITNGMRELLPAGASVRFDLEGSNYEGEITQNGEVFVGKLVAARSGVWVAYSEVVWLPKDFAARFEAKWEGDERSEFESMIDGERLRSTPTTVDGERTTTRTLATSS